MEGGITLLPSKDPARARVDAAPSSANETVPDRSERLTVSDNRSLEYENFFRGWTSAPTSNL